MSRISRLEHFRKHRNQRKEQVALHRVKRWSKRFRVYFPKGPWPDQGYFNSRLPVGSALLSPPSANPQFQKRCARLVVQAALNAIKGRPRHLEHVRVVAITSSPDMFRDEVCFFFDEDTFRSFTNRNSPHDTWVPIDAPSLADRLAIMLPEHIQERGFRFIRCDDTFDPPYREEGEIWLIGDI